MQLITAIHEDSDQSYWDMYHNLNESAKAVGYDDVRMHLTSAVDAYRRNVNTFVPCYFKPQAIFNELRAYNPEPVLWVDLDCLIVKRIDEMQIYDVTVTLRNPPGYSKCGTPLYDGYLNAGVLGFANTLGARSFIDRWYREMESSNSDQHALNKLLLKHTDLMTIGEVVKIEDIEIKIAPCDIYNYFAFGSPFEDAAKIMHFKGSLRPKFYNQYVDKILGDKGKHI